ncbi:MAG TPA: TldD/PmbA family protein [Acidimicrobiales bacterium]|nr:TldD/PmbA family protein [Acidimicrobiales bacterium]
MSDLLELAERVLGWSRESEGAEVYVSRGTDTQVQVYQAEVESLSSATSEGVGIRVVVEGRQGFAFVGSLEEAAIGEAFQEARDNAAFATPEEWVGLPAPDGASPTLHDLWRDELGAYSVQLKVAQALDLERHALASGPRITSVESARWADVASEMALASTLGVRATDRSTACYISVSAVAADGAGSKRGYGYSIGRGPSELDPEKACNDAVTRAVRLLGAKQPPSAHLPVVFEPRVAAHLLGFLSSLLSGERVLKGTSLFADRLGEAVAAPGVTLVDDPTNEAAWGASSFDDEGLACRPNTMIDNGALSCFLYDSTSARRAGTSSTASAVRAGFKSAPGVGARAVYLKPGELAPEEVLSHLGHGLLVQSASGFHSGVNPISGDFSVGVEGLLFDGGALAAPVREVTIASSIQRMLLGVAAIGADLQWLPSAAAGMTLAISEMSMSGA